MTKITVDDWTGCYPSKWKSVIVEDAMRHPAKFSSRLIRRIYEHMIGEGWLKPGDVVIDPFGGVGLGALDAMRSGMRWRGVELEARFAEVGNKNIALWNSRYSTMPRWNPDAILLQGDSRNLVQVLGNAEHRAVMKSPPYAESLGNEEKGGIDWGKQTDRKTDHPHGWNGAGYSQAAISSPPYADGCAHTGGPVVQPLPGTGGKNELVDYGSTPGQLGAMKGNGFDAAVSSPPFMAAQTGGGIAKVGYQNDEMRKGSEEHPFDLVGKRAYMPENQGTHVGNLANMPAGDFDASVSSPPYLPKDDRKVPWGTTVGKTLEEEAERRGFKRDESFRGTYSLDPANLGNPTGADQTDFWSAARTIVEQVYQVLAPGAHAAWVVKSFVRNKEIVDFPGQWRQLCEVVGFVTLHEHHALLVRHTGTSMTLEGGTVEHKTESKSFFRRLAEKNGSPRIDFEVVLCMEKPA